MTDKTKSLEIAAERAVKEKDAVIVGEQELVAETQKASARISELEVICVFVCACVFVCLCVFVVMLKPKKLVPESVSIR